MSGIHGMDGMDGTGGALDFEGVSVAQGGCRLLDALSFSLPAHRLTGVVGPNGAGKTTLLRTALGLRAPTHGRVRLLGRPLAGWPARERAARTGYLPQQPESHWDLRVDELLRLQSPSVPASLAARCELAPLLGRRFATLSGGERARVGIARALAHRPALLLADEPGAHLDLPHAQRLMTLLREVAHAGVDGTPCTVLVVLHDLHLAARHCDHLLLLSQGRRVAEGPPGEVLRAEPLARAYGAPVAVHEADGLRFFSGVQA